MHWKQPFLCSQLTLASGRWKFFSNSYLETMNSRSTFVSSSRKHICSSIYKEAWRDRLWETLATPSDTGKGAKSWHWSGKSGSGKYKPSKNEKHHQHSSGRIQPWRPPRMVFPTSLFSFRHLLHLYARWLLHGYASMLLLRLLLLVFGQAYRFPATSSLWPCHVTGSSGYGYLHIIFIFKNRF